MFPFQILQRRPSGRVFGDRYWQDYKVGFGSTSNKHWLGNDKIFHLANQRNNRLRVDLEFSNGSKAYQEYSLFKIANESDNYRLIELGSSSGNAGDGMKGSLLQQFSTSDRDNDECDGIDCSAGHGNSGWWHSKEWCNECCHSEESTCFFQSSSKCNKRCTKANLNGGYNCSSLPWKIFWNGFHNIVSTEMKIRP
ncbi:Angiopoietin-related protein 1 [Holothuria leucospilota]|uniref:Angiopoietin-related protein 1 n=1 Tax=Holothuria leucospilota TaxID=206669 RepID=A0A9Q0YQ27_HOLLE|nr:Angiopoietin-related protein 1 [Holothuria leucospilota]